MYTLKMARCGLKRKGNRKNRGNDHEEENFENSMSQEFQVIDEQQSNYMRCPTRNMDVPTTITIMYNYGGYFSFTPWRTYVNGNSKQKCDLDIDFIAYFDLLDELKNECEFNILDGDKFYYLKPTRVLADLDGLIEVKDDGDVQAMLEMYKNYTSKTIDIYALKGKYDVLPTSTPEEDFRNFSSGEMAQAIVQEGVAHESNAAGLKKRKTRGPSRGIRLIALEKGEKLSVEFDGDHEAVGENSTDFVWFLGQTVRNRTCCPLEVKEWKDISEDKIMHMWSIVLEKFTFEIPNGRKDAIIAHMNALYRDYRHKMKKKYFDSKATFQSRLKNKPKSVNSNDWKYLVNLWSETAFQDKSMKNKQNRSKRSMPPYTGTKSYARLRHQMKLKNGKEPSRVELFIESRKRKGASQIDSDTQDALSQLDQLKKQQVEGQISLNDDEIFEKVLGPEKNGYLRAYGPGKNITEYFGSRPTKVELIKQVEAAKREANEQMEVARKEASERVEEVKNEMEKQMDTKIAELNRQWELKFKEMFLERVQQGSTNNEDPLNEVRGNRERESSRTIYEAAGTGKN